LHSLLDRIPAPTGDPNLLVGRERYDDAAVYAIGGGRVAIQTIDFFTPIVDDPRDFGGIAVANALSDVYAMGGVPKTALSVVCFPTDDLPLEILAQILLGGQAKLDEAGVLLVGGHSIKDPELKYGLSVLGFGTEGEILTTAAARPGDVLLLTKPLGTGILTTALKAGELPEASLRAVTDSMLRLNDRASAVLRDRKVRAATDVTGFGLLGHAVQFADASGVTFEIEAARLPLFDGALALAARKIAPGGLHANRGYFGPRTRKGEGVPPERETLAWDPQTSGGLLAAVPEREAGRTLADLEGLGVAARIGRVVVRKESSVHLV
jgi:selenide,water dikinase